MAARLAGMDILWQEAVAKATRWLSVIRRDFGQAEFEGFIEELNKL